MEITLTLIGIIITIVVAIYFGKKALSKRDASEITKRLDSLERKFDGVAVYLDGLPRMTDKVRKSLFDTGIKAMNEYK